MPLLLNQPHGEAGIRFTIATMRQLVNNSYMAPLIRDQAAMVIRGCERGDFKCMCSALLAWVQLKMTYIPDPAEVEALHAPLLIARAVQWNMDNPRRKKLVYGDCDDFSVYLASLLKAVGLRPRFKAVGYRGKFYQHIHVACGSFRLDATRNPNATAMSLLAQNLPETSAIDEVV